MNAAQVEATSHVGRTGVRAPARAALWSTRRVTTRASLVILGLVGALAHVLQLVFEALLHSGWNGTAAWAVVAIPMVGVLGLTVWKRRVVIRWLSNLRFGIALLIAVSAATALGTFLVQRAAPAEYYARYGPLAAVVRWLNLDDVFHAWWFIAILGVSVVSQSILVVRRKGWRWSELGFLLAHGGIVALLLGGFVGMLAGAKGMVHLKVGKSSNAYVSERDGRVEQLPFRVHLLGFRVERRAPSYRIYAYARAGDDGWKPIASFDPATTRRASVPGGLRFEVRSWRRPQSTQGSSGGASASAAASTSAPAGPPAVKVGVGGQPRWLVVGDATRDSLSSNDGKVSVQVAASVEEAAVRAVGAEHLLGAPDGSLKPVTIGQRVEIDGKTWVVERFLPDFRWDIDTKRAWSASKEPKNPALGVRPLGEDGKPSGETVWVFASGVSMGHDGQTPPLRYAYHGTSNAEWNVVLVPAKRLAVIGHNGKIVGKSHFDNHTSAPVGGVKVAIYSVAQHAGASSEKASKASQLASVSLRVFAGGRPVDLTLREDESGVVPIGRGDVALGFKRKGSGIENYVSTVRIQLPDGTERTARVSVNHPLMVAGFGIYQANYDPDDPTYAGLLVVRDPGLTVVYIGLISLILGVFHILFLRPRIRARRKRNRALAAEVAS